MGEVGGSQSLGSVPTGQRGELRQSSLASLSLFPICGMEMKSLILPGSL